MGRRWGGEYWVGGRSWGEVRMGRRWGSESVGLVGGGGGGVRGWGWWEEVGVG